MTRKRSRIGLGGGFRVLAVATRQNVWAAQLSAALLALPVSK